MATRERDASVAGTALRRRLFLLTAAAILPLAVMTALSLRALRNQQTAQVEQVGLELARSVGNAVDGELGSVVAILETLATTRAVDTDDLAGFQERVARVLRLQPKWAAISLNDTSGRVLVDARTPGDAGTSTIVDRESFERVLATSAPTIGNLTRHPDVGWRFAVHVPVRRGTAVTYVVSALITPEAIRDVLTRQDVPGDWIISIVDTRGRRVARSRAHEENVGGRLTPTGQAILDRGGSQGFGISYALEGERIFTPYARLPRSGWLAVLGLPTALVDTAATSAVVIYGGGLLLSLVLGTLGALWVARTITRPIEDLRAAAEAVGRKETPRATDTSIEEIRAVGHALKTAARDLATAEAEREDLLHKERLARAAAEAADRAKDEFMAVLSHELRTPLSAVYGWAKMLQSGQVRGAAAERAYNAIVRNADVQVQLIDDLLDLSRITTGKLRLDMRRVDVPDVLRGALDAVRPAAEAKGIQLHAAFDADLAAVAGDPARLQQVAWNLLMNAVKFTPKGGSVDVRIRRAHSHLELRVSDTGQGIAPDMLPHVFERFRQGDSSSTRLHRGLGLGLALVKHLVELHGGTVVAESDGAGRGAAFTVMLPIALADVTSEARQRPAPPAAPAEPVERSGARLDGMRVLVADDDGEGLGLAEAILTRAGAEVRTCTSAPSAFDLLKRWRPDVLVSDIEMPGEDGYALIRKIRALRPEEGGATPAIALTAYGRMHDRLRSLAAGFDMHVPKPVDPAELTTLVAGASAQARN